MKTLRTLGLLATLLAAQGVAHASNDVPVQSTTQAHHTQPASGQSEPAPFQVQVAAATLGLKAPSAFGHHVQESDGPSSSEAQPSGTLLLLAGLALLGAVIYRRCSADSDRA